MEMVERRATNAPPYTLFLGQECARVAGVPSPLEMSREFFSRLKGHELAKRYLPNESPSDDELREAFRLLLADLPPTQRGSLLLQFYAALPVPLFYQELAMLVAAGFFNQILTTNLDSLFERALQNAGFRADMEYRVVLLDRKQPTPVPDGDDAAQVMIWKLHGDPSGPQFAVSGDEIESALQPVRRAVTGALEHDIVMVGYDFESRPVTEWLAKVPGELCWVSEEQPPREKIAAIDLTRNVRFVDGPSGAPSGFFGGLAMRLLQMPTAHLLQSATPVGDSAGGPPPLPDTTPPQDEVEFEREFLRGQLRRANELLRRLENQVVTGTTNDRLERQLAYQKGVVAELEAGLRTTGDDSGEVLGVLELVSDAAASSGGSDSTTAFLREQVEAVRHEYSSQTPDEALVSGVIGATLVIGDRLGVDRSLLRQLAEFAPSSLRVSL